MKYVLNIFLLTMISIMILSCDVTESSESIFSPLDTKIDFSIFESYDNNYTISKPKLFLELVTEKIYGCSNFEITTDYSHTDKKIKINILGIKSPDACLTSLGPATARIDLGKLAGIYEIIIQGNSFIDNYSLLISDSLIIIDGKETTNTKSLTGFQYRYPENSFVYLYGSTLSDSSLCNKFIDTLKSVVDISEFNFSNIAKSPYPQSSMWNQYNANARHFYYNNEDDYEKIESVLRSFKISYFPTDNGVTIRIINWMNKRIYSSSL